jgi:hypothetical protein
MQEIPKSTRMTFYAIGLSYKKADAKVRGLFSLDVDKKTITIRTSQSKWYIQFGCYFYL